MQRLLNDAIQEAISLLSEDPNCAAVFTSPTTGASAINPATLLSDLQGGEAGPGPYGSIGFGPLRTTPGILPGTVSYTNATTTPVPQYGMVNGQNTVVGMQVFITINTDPNSPYNKGTAYDRAVTLLHELGHAYNILFGTGSSHIIDDQGDSPAARSHRCNAGCWV